MSVRSIRSWPQFARQIRSTQTDLLTALPQQHRPILIAGCQRSGGTMLAGAFTEHADVEDFSWSKDAELDAAQVLAGYRQPPRSAQDAAGKRFCFQTTYLNERFVEYQEHTEHFHLIWLVRNPFSVVYSMLYNWKRFALNEVFLSCGAALLPYRLQRRLGKYGVLGVPALDRACYAWLGKLEQTQILSRQLPADRLMLVEYETLVTSKEQLMQKLGDFVQLANVGTTGAQISTRSLAKADRFKEAERRVVESLCAAPYQEFLNSMATD